MVMKMGNPVGRHAEHWECSSRQSIYAGGLGRLLITASESDRALLSSEQLVRVLYRTSARPRLQQWDSA